MSRARLFFRTPPFKSPSTTFTAHRHANRSQLELPLQSRLRWSYLWYGSILAIGVATGLGARQFAAPLGLPAPGSPEDRIILQSLSDDIDKLDIVRTLRKQSANHLHTGTPILESGSVEKVPIEGWVEVDVDLARHEETSSRKGILGAMSGTRGLGVQRAFWNPETKELVAVVWIGGGLSGWPGVAHGGAIATIFEEAMARMVRGPVGDVDAIHRPTSVSITYAKPTYSLDLYILRASFSKPNIPQSEPPPESETEPTRKWLSWLSPKKDLTKKVDVKAKHEITGTLESMKGDLCVKVKGTFDDHGTHSRRDV
ncbi:hypothetical protein FB567DRAFT_519473 [Paraphoma chrysanthemicola]|uniref:Thioesterase domain-containing protein n=1 Tax=Paraphoma chrysanthemicola TaxID=798071 RepID=A0A8K0RCT7_9PLEO|nr:hypothetical protein FB567DRAFT_519473 [Paraphoma chrysanthemicola]